MFMKYSRQRELILNTVAQTPVHPTADTVYHAIRGQLPNISLGTVYRNLKLLSELGVLRRIPVPSSSDRFDARISPHDHMICEHCGQVFDVELEALTGLAQIVKDKTGFAVSSHSLMIQGICKDCQIKIQKERGKR